MNSKIEELQTRPVQPKPSVPAYHDPKANPQTSALAGVPMWALATAGAVGALVALVTIPT
jgi:hypothetical protein